MLCEMLAEERRFQIREILGAQRSVSASDLCDRLKVTAATIRRDLFWMATPFSWKAAPRYSSWRED